MTNGELGRLAGWGPREERKRLKSQPFPLVSRAVSKKGVLDATSGGQVRGELGDRARQGARYSEQKSCSHRPFPGCDVPVGSFGGSPSVGIAGEALP